MYANGHINPYFICRTQENIETYDIMINQREEIALNNCTNVLVDQIIDRILSTNLRARPFRLYMSTVNLNSTRLENATELDLSRNDLSYVNVQNFVHLKVLNLTSNNVRTLRSIKLRTNTTLTELDLSRNRLLKLEHFFIPSTIRLRLCSNNIFEVDENVILPETLRLLDLTRNEIENVSFVSFQSERLRVLNLSINLINAISKTTFERLSDLEILILECNKIYEIEESTFSRNAKLIELNLRDNNLSILRRGVFDELVNLQVLDISKNDLLKLAPDTVQNLNNLATFSVSENFKLCEAECKNELEFLLVLGGRLRDLKMDRLRLRQFPEMLTTSVRLLDLSKNYLKRVEQGDLENFPFLESLLLSSNFIETTENEVFSRMEFLKVLHLDNNKLKRVPSTLSQSLSVLFLNNNRIKSVEKNDFYGLVNLKVLKINSNLIQSVESGSFRYLKNLEVLDISENPIVTLSTDAFEGPINIKILHASALKNIRINVTDVRYFPISEMPNLRVLNLSRSPELAKSFLTDIPLLATVKLLEILDFSYTNLTHIPSHLENFLPRLKSFVLLGNPLNCTNNWLSNWKRSNDLNIHDFDQPFSGLKIHVNQKPLKPLYEHVFVESKCRFSIANLTIVSKEEFWSMMETATHNRITHLKETPHYSRYENLTSTVNDKFKSHEYELIRLKNLFKYDSTRTVFVDTFDKIFTSLESTTNTIGSFVRKTNSTQKRKKLYSRSLQPLHAVKFTYNLSSPMNVTSSTNILEILNVSRALHKLKYSSTLHTEQTSEIFKPYASNKSTTNSSNEKRSADVQSRSTRIFSFNLITTSSPLTLRYEDEKKHTNSNLIVLKNNLENMSSLSPSLQTLTSKNFRNEKLPFTFSSINNRVTPPKSVSSLQGTKVTLSPVTELFINTEESSTLFKFYNQTGDRMSSFFDWFPASKASNESTDFTERAAALDDQIMEYTHPGLIIFLTVTFSLAVLFVSLVIPSYMQKYRWRRQRYKISEFDNECQKSIEISSVSAFVETEISLE